MAGYSGTPLPQKLGIKPGHRVALLNAPDGFDDILGHLPDGTSVQRSLTSTAPFDIIVAFFTERTELASQLAPMRRRLTQAGGLWIAWPKRASKAPTDITEDVVRDVALPTGLVDNKVCAIDTTWSGLRLVVRREHRT